MGMWKSEGGASDMRRERLGEGDMRDGGGGAHICNNWERTRGEVRAASSYQTLSHYAAIIA